MKLDVLLFSVLEDAAGRDKLELELPEGRCWKVADLLARLYQDYEQLERWDHCLLISADLQYVSRDTELRDGQEIAIMPPVQGG